MPEETAAKPPVPARVASPLELRPLAQVRRIPLIEREIRERLSQAALDALFAHSEVLSEGETGQGASKEQFTGSTMLTFDVSVLAELLREPADEGTARRLAGLLAKERTLTARIEAIVREEVTRITSKAPRQVRGETRIRTQDTRVFLDVDVEASFT